MEKNSFTTKSRLGLFAKTKVPEVGAEIASFGHVGRGDAARSRTDWIAAALHYRAAVSEDSSLRHIWIQLGHAEKERGALDAAEQAYLTADELPGGDGEPALHLGHLAKLRGDLVEAKRQYLRAVDDNPDLENALAELSALVGRTADVGDNGFNKALQRRAKHKRDGGADVSAVRALEALLHRRRDDLDPATLEALVSAKALLAGLEALGADEAEAEPAAATRQSLVFDASDLISYFRNARLPTGIQRVQIEVISNALRSHPGSRVCCFADTSENWIDVPGALFLEICVLAVSGGELDDPEWIAAMEELRATVMLGDPLKFEFGAFLVNLGTSWWLQNYFLHVRHAKERFGIRYVPFVHDFIPIMAPEHCVKELSEDFVSWTLGVFQHADFFLVNSEATKSDLHKVAGILGHEVDPDHVVVVPLNADFRRPGRRDLPESALSNWQLRKDRYVLIVSTIESRKNHALAFDAWLDLVSRYGAQKVPKLVCVGNRGWLNDTVYARLQNSELSERVVMLSHLSDEELTLLYRNCLFTLYPSLYEGWGLPVTESLCYAKVPLISDSSSLPEAGGEFAVYFSSGSLHELVEGLEHMIFDDTFRLEREERILLGFKPRQWTEIAEQIDTALLEFAEAVEGREPELLVPPAVFGKYHPIERNYERRIWKGYVSAEIYRAGSGWWWPDNWGCWTKAKGGLLRMRLPAGHSDLRAYFLIHGTPDTDCGFSIDINMGEASATGVLAGGEYRWVAIDIQAETPDVMEVLFRGTTHIDLAPRTGGLDTRIISVGVAGFFVCEADDLLTRATITEAILLRAQKSMAFNKPPRIGADAAAAATKTQAVS